MIPTKPFRFQYFNISKDDNDIIEPILNSMFQFFRLWKWCQLNILMFQKVIIMTMMPTNQVIRFQYLNVSKDDNDYNETNEPVDSLIIKVISIIFQIFLVHNRTRSISVLERRERHLILMLLVLVRSSVSSIGIRLDHNI